MLTSQIKKYLTPVGVCSIIQVHPNNGGIMSARRRRQEWLNGLSDQELHTLMSHDLKYNENTGLLTRVNARRKCDIGPVKYFTDRDGYLRLTWKDKSFMSHRVIWFLQTGEWPNIIDHTNQDKKDNRWINLRNVNPIQSCANRDIEKTEGKGVYQHKNGYWEAKIVVSGNKIYLGRFTNREDAQRSYDNTDREWNGAYSSRHHLYEKEALSADISVGE